MCICRVATLTRTMPGRHFVVMAVVTVMVLAIGCAHAARLASSPALDDDARVFSFESDVVFLRPSEVHNKIVTPRPLPTEMVAMYGDAEISLIDMTMDILYTSGERAPLSKIYNHHFFLYVGNELGVNWIHDYIGTGDPFNPTNPATQCFERSLENLNVNHHQRSVSLENYDHISMRTRLMSMATAEVALDELMSIASSPAARSAYLNPPPPFPVGGTLVMFGGNTGAEYRNNSNKLENNFVYDVVNATHFSGVYHFINLDQVPDAEENHHLYECPCTPQRKFDIDAITIDGMCPVFPFYCSDALLSQENPACLIETYKSGYRCCENGVFLVDTDEYPEVKSMVPAQVFAQFKVTVRPHRPVDRPVATVRCCDATSVSYLDDDTTSGFNGNIEADILSCGPNLPFGKTCNYVIDTVLPIGRMGRIAYNKNRPETDFIELVRVAAHLHTGAIGMTMSVYKSQRYSNNTVICEASIDNGRVIYGNEPNEVGNEAGLLVGIEPCMFFNGEFILHYTDLVRVTARYQSMRGEPDDVIRRAVMSIFLIKAAVPQQNMTLLA